MAYKKYIKRGDKVYGPYIYHSKRVGGKVVTEYKGSGRKFDFGQLFNSKFLGVFLGILGIFILAFAFYVFINTDKGVTGFSVFDVDADYNEGMLKGTLRIFLNEGELIPVDTKIFFKGSNYSYNYSLRELVSSEIVNGTYFIKGQNLSGSGEGYGIPGEKKIYPNISFILSISSLENEGVNESSNNILDSNLDKDNQTQNKTLKENFTNVSETENATNFSEEILNETSNKSNQDIYVNETKNNSEAATFVNSSNESSLGLGLVDIISNFFLSLNPTGNVVVKFEREVNGKVSKGNDFFYTLDEGETAEIKLRSVENNGKKLSDDVIEINLNGSQVKVSTNYSEIGEGFGEDYLGDDFKEIEISLEKLEDKFEPGNLSIFLSYLGSDFMGTNTSVEGAKGFDTDLTEQNKTNISGIQVDNISINDTKKNVTEQIPLIPEKINLSDKEKQILEENFEDISVEISDAVFRNGFLVVRYELGQYWIESSYPEDLDKEVLEVLMYNDRIKWLKDLSKRFSEKENKDENTADDLLGQNFSF